MNKQQMKELLLLIENAYPRFLPDDGYKAKGKVDLWCSYMKDWDYERTNRNIRRHIADSVFEPKIAEVKAPIEKRLSVAEQLRRGGVDI